MSVLRSHQTDATAFLHPGSFLHEGLIDLVLSHYHSNMRCLILVFDDGVASVVCKLLDRIPRAALLIQRLMHRRPPGLANALTPRYCITRPRHLS